MASSALEVFATTVNEMDDRLPKGRSRCFDIGSWGGCGVTCPAFQDGECGEPQEITREEVEEEYGEEEAENICYRYDCYDIEGQ